MWKAVGCQINPSAERKGDMEGNIQSRHRASPQHHLQGLQGADGIEKGVGKTPWAKCQGFLRTGAETVSRTGPRAGTEPRTGGWDWGQALGGLPRLRKDGADLGRKSQKEFKPGSQTIGGVTKAPEGGQSRQGGCWGPRTGLRTGLSRSMETVSCLEPIYREKNLSWQLRTL